MAEAVQLFADAMGDSDEEMDVADVLAGVPEGTLPGAGDAAAEAKAEKKKKRSKKRDAVCLAMVFLMLLDQRFCTAFLRELSVVRSGAVKSNVRSF